MAAPDLPYWRLSAFYLFFFAVLGGLAPYWGPYLAAEGFSAAQIGQLIAILHATKIVAPNLWGVIADRTGRRMAVVRIGALAAMLTFTGVLLGSTFWWIALVMVLFSFFWNAALPQFEANTLNHLGRADHRYSRIRLWGSVGFIIAVVGFGELIDRFGVHILPWLLLVMFAGLWVASQVAPGARQPVRRHHSDPILSVLLRPDVIGFFLACFLLKASHGPYYAFFSIYLEDAGYSSSMIGILWAVGVVAEIGLFLVMHRLLPRFGARLLMTVAMLLSALRWGLIALAPQLLPVLLFAQGLHAASFGVYHAVGIALVNRYFVGSNQGRGQALYSSITFGAGVAVGSLFSGLLWDVVGGSATFYLGALVAVLAAIIAVASLPGQEGAQEGAGASSA
ncbi:MFS transporter [Aquisalimonas asiatica]|uniref:MFS transporter, PPP family, 3-phenylpropionic acid transporter n=1 Tax=Aquisalimonas asiatica TaxID=406100 RepID=A0A1H8RP31_9GAMM|nr:MFS transporter [Aquisalimonas asiatica]SEO68140.1 MFS transporter, PPP family, 3-phenylpropionic acid transporter [Aquisalimonas asiatica]